eukprot:768499-Hanusia_phi.AAC.2
MTPCTPTTIADALALLRASGWETGSLLPVPSPPPGGSCHACQACCKVREWSSRPEGSCPRQREVGAREINIPQERVLDAGAYKRPQGDPCQLVRRQDAGEGARGKKHMQEPAAATWAEKEARRTPTLIGARTRQMSVILLRTRSDCCSFSASLAVRHLSQSLSTAKLLAKLARLAREQVTEEGQAQEKEGGDDEGDLEPQAEGDGLHPRVLLCEVANDRTPCDVSESRDQGIDQREGGGVCTVKGEEEERDRKVPHLVCKDGERLRQKDGSEVRLQQRSLLRPLLLRFHRLVAADT